jgi:hypothetical protein
MSELGGELSASFLLSFLFDLLFSGLPIVQPR